MNKEKIESSMKVQAARDMPAAAFSQMNNNGDNKYVWVYLEEQPQE